ncbi:hypothetical protein OH705_27380, partial [Pseudomonas sp. BJa3]|nr:hypothetical protein [Pseudomonas sp. BJa3]
SIFTHSVEPRQSGAFWLPKADPFLRIKHSIDTYQKKIKIQNKKSLFRKERTKSCSKKPCILDFNLYNLSFVHSEISVCLSKKTFITLINI